MCNMRCWLAPWNIARAEVRRPSHRRALGSLARLLESRKPVIEAFEERYLLSVSAPNAADAVIYADSTAVNAAVATVGTTSFSGAPTYADFPGGTGMEPIAPHVVGRSVFYNNSPQDGNDPNPNAAD